jgi:hypothetical protein
MQGRQEDTVGTVGVGILSKVTPISAELTQVVPIDPVERIAIRPSFKLNFYLFVRRPIFHDSTPVGRTNSAGLSASSNGRFRRFRITWCRPT